MRNYPAYIICLVIQLLLTSCGARGYVPLGVGSIIHVCGEIVDEDLKPIKGKIEMEIWVTRPMLTLKGDSKNDHYKKTIDGPNFCLNYGYAWDVMAFLKSNKFISPTISIGRGMIRNNFKWVVEKRDTIIENNNFRPGYFCNSNLDTNLAWSSSSGGIAWVENTNAKWGLEEKDVDVIRLTKMGGIYDSSLNSSQLREVWLRKYPGTIVPTKSGNYYVKFNLNTPKYLTDIIMGKQGDSLVLKTGPLVKTKFAVATIDSPVCNFSRMANPPPLGSAAWQDSLVIAKNDKVLVDGFYAYFPWNNYWAKALLDTVVIKQKDRLVVRYLLMQEAVKEHPTFPNKIDGYEDFFLRKKCLTKAEKMWAGEYNTVFKSE